MATTYEIINGISQAIAGAHDGGLDSEGNPLNIGLRREEGDPLIDSRVIDGFSVRFHGGNKLCITYSAEIKLREVYSTNFESDIDQMIEDISSFIKKEYRKITGSSLTLKKDDEVHVIVENISRVRSIVRAYKVYEIGGMEAEAIQSESDDGVRDATRKFLELGKNSRKRPTNTKDKKDNFKHFEPWNIVSGPRNSDLK